MPPQRFIGLTVPNPTVQAASFNCSLAALFGAQNPNPIMFLNYQLIAVLRFQTKAREIMIPLARSQDESWSHGKKKLAGAKVNVSKKHRVPGIGGKHPGCKRSSQHFPGDSEMTGRWFQVYREWSIALFTNQSSRSYATHLTCIILFKSLQQPYILLFSPFYKPKLREGKEFVQDHTGNKRPSYKSDFRASTLNNDDIILPLWKNLREGRREMKTSGIQVAPALLEVWVYKNRPPTCNSAEGTSTVLGVVGTSLPKVPWKLPKKGREKKKAKAMWLSVIKSLA